MNPVVANWITTGTGTNVVVVGDQKQWEVKFELPSPPSSVAELEIRIVEEIRDLDRNVIAFPSGHDHDKFFRGKIVNGKWVCTLHQWGKDRSALKNNEFRVFDADKKNGMRATIFDPERVGSHILTLATTAKEGGQSVDFTGTQQVHVRFPLAMVIPKGTATLDKALNMIPKYAKSWQGKLPSHRHVEPTKMLVTRQLNGQLKASHYDDIVRALKAAAEKATGGIVALSVGHGGLGSGVSSVPFINLVPEDNAHAVTHMSWLARIDQTDLAPYDEAPAPGAVKSIPSDNTKARLDALDRIGDALKGTPIRRLLLHTCNAGNAPDFVQLIANRVRVPVVAQRDFIWFSPTASWYDKDGGPKLPRDEEFWPVHRMGEVMIPKDPPPPRFGPP